MKHPTYIPFDGAGQYRLHNGQIVNLDKGAMCRKQDGVINVRGVRGKWHWSKDGTIGGLGFTDSSLLYLKEKINLPTPPKGYRILNDDEIIQTGDYFSAKSNRKDGSQNGWLICYKHHNGTEVKNDHVDFARKIEEDNAIDLDKKDYFIQSNSEEESKKIQDILFKRGHSWHNTKGYANLFARYIGVYSKGKALTFSNNDVGFGLPKDVLTYEDLRKYCDIKPEEEKSILEGKDLLNSKFDIDTKQDFYYFTSEPLSLKENKLTTGSPTDLAAIAPNSTNTSKDVTQQTTQKKEETMKPIKATKNWLTTPARNFAKATNWTLQHLVFAGLIASLPVGAYYGPSYAKKGYDIVKSIKITWNEDSIEESDTEESKHILTKTKD